MSDTHFFVDGKNISADECRQIFLSAPLGDRELRCLDLVEGTSILDIGCYSGRFVDELLKADPSRVVVGIDYYSENLKIARFLYPQNTYLYSSVYALELDDVSVDCVTFQEVIEHLEGAAQAIKEINRVLKPGGLLILSTPQPYYWRDMASFFVREIFGLLRIRRKLRPAIYFEEVEWNRHIYCWTPPTLLTLLVTNGFEYVTHCYGRDANNPIERLFLRLFSFFGPTQIMKVRKVSEAEKSLV